MSGTRVLDSYALLSFFQGERGSAQVEALLNQAEQSGDNLLMSAVNWGEVYYSIMRKLGAAVADEKAAQIDLMALDIIDADKVLTRTAAQMKASHSLAYGDCFAAALAKQRKGELVTGDREFEVLADEIRILWI
ncbi:MAG: type II toxin-antitoxin system VapC family toxin [Candidatus Eremiobacteraeota bacterium]|nr:type II toxin-antitoxin system VapC family toxin [Candidatus Eremiobacteraeota bacterium]